jgi:hypothetical protein
MTELKPVKFGIKPIEPNKVSPTTKPDQFGQVYDNQQDVTAGANIPSALESQKQHRQSDVDSTPKAQHHTLGPGRNQASPGNHIHDGTTSPKIGELEMDPAANGQTRAAWTIPAAPTVNDLVTLLAKFVNFRQV